MSNDFDNLTRTVLTTDARSERLWRMTKAERIAAMWRGELPLADCLAWSARTPREVPLIGDEFAYIVIGTPEWQGD